MFECFLRHCEEQSDEAIQTFFGAMDCFAALAMTILTDYRIVKGPNRWNIVNSAAAA
jgi:hypothetical protein